jgi:hypothetical protein
MMQMREERRGLDRGAVAFSGLLNIIQAFASNRFIATRLDSSYSGLLKPNGEGVFSQQWLFV